MNIQQSISDIFRSVGLEVRSEERFFNIAFAKALKNRFGSTVNLYCATEEERVFYENHNNGEFDNVSIGHALLRKSREPVNDPAAVVQRSRELEARYSLRLNRLAVNSRHLGRGFSLGGFRHPRSRYSELSSYEQVLHAYNSQIEHWQHLIECDKLTIMLNGDTVAEPVARANGIAFRTMAGSRHENLHNWAWNAHQGNPEIWRRYEEMIDQGISEDPTLEINKPYHYHAVSRDRFIQSFGLFTLCKYIALQIGRHIFWNLRGYQKAKGYYLSSENMYYIRQWSDWKWLNKNAQGSLAQLENTDFVFFPLATEPETALQGLSPEYFFQLESIALLSKELPAGYKIAVKETFFAVGRRPDNFYRQIMEFKNVVMLRPDELGVNCARLAKATITINGTAGLEAATAGRPVIVFGRHNNFDCLKHVSVVKDPVELTAALDRALSDDFDREAAKREGLRYLSASSYISFEMGEYDFVDLETFNSEVVDGALTALERSITFELAGSV
jgi:hypothetical protein